MHGNLAGYLSLFLHAATSRLHLLCLRCKHWKVVTPSICRKNSSYVMTRQSFCGHGHVFVFFSVFCLFVCFPTLLRESVLRKRSSHVIAVELTALWTDNKLYSAKSFEKDACYLERAAQSLERAE